MIKKFGLKNLEIPKITTTFEMIIIGGGITGAGIFLDAQSRGLECCLIEKNDFASGTSSKSTRLIHGGLRYLKQFNFELVKETGGERQVLYDIASHLVRPVQVIVPISSGGTFSRWSLYSALVVYDYIAKVPRQYKHRRLTRSEVINTFPDKVGTKILGGVEYTEYTTNDARLVIENIKKGVEYGGVAFNNFKVLDVKKIKGEYIVSVHCLLSDSKRTLRSRSVINATGVWTESLLKQYSTNFFAGITPTKGVHIVFNKTDFPIQKIIYFDTQDRRMIFAIPYIDKVYVGTTDTFYDNDVNNVFASLEDIEYLITACNTFFEGITLTKKMVTSSWAGVRPLITQKGKKPSEISRKHEIIVHNDGVLTIAGGKLTGYRNMAEKIVNQAIQLHFSNLSLAPCNTKKIKLIGNETKENQTIKDYYTTFLSKSDRIKNLNLQEKQVSWLFRHFGTEITRIMDYQPKNRNLPIEIDLSLQYCLEYEMVISPLDYFIRRTDLMYFYPKKVKEYYVEVIKAMVEYTDYMVLSFDSMKDQVEKELDKVSVYQNK